MVTVYGFEASISNTVPCVKGSPTVPLSACSDDDDSDDGGRGRGKKGKGKAKAKGGGGGRAAVCSACLHAFKCSYHVVALII